MVFNSSENLGYKESIDLNQYKDLFGITKDGTLATRNLQGIPNIVPIHSKHIISKNKILITDQFMNKTKNNIINYPYAMLSIQEGNILFRASGKCQYQDSGSEYEMAVQMVEEYARTNQRNKEIEIKCKGIIIIDVDKLEEIQI